MRIFFRSGAVVAAALILCAAVLTLKLQAQAPQKPWTKDQIIRMLKGDVSPKRVETLARERGIDFQITSETETELRTAGATDSLLATLREIAPKPSAPTPPPPATLLIESTPGGVQVYLNDEFKGATSSEGKLRINAVPPGQHRVRLSRAGYSDREEELNLAANATRTYTANLEAINPTGPGQRTDANQLSTAPVRYRVAFIHGLGGTDGWMTVEKALIRFEGDMGRDSAEIPVAELKDVRETKIKAKDVSFGFEIRLMNGKKYRFAVKTIQESGAEPGTLLRRILSVRAAARAANRHEI